MWFTRPVFLPSTVELVVEQDPRLTVAALRPAREAAKTHLVLTLDA